nr:hypothetical protein [uncultured Rhodopila sp.]
MRRPRPDGTGKAGSRIRRTKGKNARVAAPMPKAGRPDRLAERITGSAPKRRPALPPAFPAGRAAAGPAAGPGGVIDASVLALAVPDWLAHTLTVSGPADRLAAFRAAAAGPGILPVQDRARLEEDVMHALLAPPPVLRSISLAGARILAGQIADRIGVRAARAAGRGAVCPFDLNALIPVPPALSDLPPDDPRLSAWLWRHWGTTWPLRQVVASPAAPAPLPPAGQALCRYRFWSADWTPWPALRTIRTGWPDLRFVIDVHYGGL